MKYIIFCYARVALVIYLVGARKVIMSLPFVLRDVLPDFKAWVDFDVLFDCAFFRRASFIGDLFVCCDRI